jgi:hypothetical protein
MTSRHWKYSFVRKTLVWGSCLTAAAATTVLAGPPAYAATPFAPIAASTVAQFSLDPGTSFDDDSQAITAVESGGAVQVLTADDVLTSGGWAGSEGLCHDTGLSGSLSPSGWCWDSADDKSDSYTSTGGWTPQGISGSYDAQPGGLWDTHTTFLASWHWDVNMQTTSPQGNVYARVSLVNADNNSIHYNHLLLVQPTLNADHTGTFTQTPDTHADGVVWYGNKVFVANGRQLQVYDLRHIWKVNSQTASVGVSGGTSSAHYSNYALPMIGEYYTTGGGACQVVTGTTPCLNSLSLDRSGTDALVSSEYYNGAGGRVIRWPLNYQTALPATTDPSGHGVSYASAGFTSPVWQMQGAATDGTTYWMAGLCPSGVGSDPNDPSAGYSCIHYAISGAAPHVLTTSPPLTENLGYDPAKGRIWGLNERINSTTGERVVFSIDK